MNEMGKILSNAFDPPPPGNDGGHQGVDFSFWQYGSHSTMEGIPVQSMLAGTVAAVDVNRYPYGNMVIVETPIEDVPLALLALHPLPTRQGLATPDSALFCPPGDDGFSTSVDGLSFYVLYAHLKDPVSFKIGDPIDCGQALSAVGTTGASVNNHLHLELRLGPAGATFSSMAHYINDATNQEMHNYCMWRVSGWFQMLDPMVLFADTP
jgi:murein DD-endopeptidase MepM/ murein hydrolase activator NlpD